MKAILTAILTIGLFLYPLAVYIGLTYANARFVGLLLFILLVLRFLLLKSQLSYARIRPFIPLTVTGLVLSIVIMLYNDETLVKLHPVLVSATFLYLFAITLLYPPSMVERIARIREPALPETGIIYTRKVTIVWCAFFVFNIIVSTYTALYSSIDVWVLYNGLISYLLMGLLFGVEFLVRLRVQRGHL